MLSNSFLVYINISELKMQFCIEISAVPISY